MVFLVVDINHWLDLRRVQCTKGPRVGTRAPTCIGGLLMRDSKYTLVEVYTSIQVYTSGSNMDASDSKCVTLPATDRLDVATTDHALPLNYYDTGTKKIKSHAGKRRHGNNWCCQGVNFLKSYRMTIVVYMYQSYCVSPWLVIRGNNMRCRESRQTRRWQTQPKLM